MQPIEWSIKDIFSILTKRQENEFDANVLVSGDRGNGKSTLICKILYRFKIFKPKKHQVYKRTDVVDLLTQERGVCWDDEAVNSGYKRDFQQKGQKDLIKIVTAYRDNFNLYFSAIPNFFSLDRDLRDLIFLHFHVIERGIAVVHMPLQGRLYSQDRWDSKYNAKVEESWSKRMQKDPSFKPPYHRLTTFRGYLYFGDLTDHQKKLYKQIKREKRDDGFGIEARKPEQLSFLQRARNLLLDGKVTREGLLGLCLYEGKRYSTVLCQLNTLLTDEGNPKTVSQYFIKDKQNEIDNKSKGEITTLVPSL